MTPKRIALVIVLAGLASLAAVTALVVLKFVPGYVTYLGATKGADCAAQQARFGSGWFTLPVKNQFLDSTVSVFDADSFQITMFCVNGQLMEVQYQLTRIPAPE